MRFQYRIVQLGMIDSARRMAEAFGFLGQHGWELVTVYDKASNWMQGMENGFALFKKQLAEGEEPVGEWARVLDSAEVARLRASFDAARGDSD